MNEVFLDTETTGLSFRDGHRVVEIACIETNDLISTGKVFHKLINPKRSVPDEAFKVHGFSEEFLKDKETFYEIADEFLDDHSQTMLEEELAEWQNNWTDLYANLNVQTALTKEWRAKEYRAEKKSKKK